MHWITEHWEILAPLVAAGIAFLFDIVLRIRGKELVPIRAYLYVILLLLAAVSFALVSQDRPQIDHLAVHLKMDYTNGNPYLNELIDSNLSRLKNGLSGEEFVTGSLESTLAELNRGMQSLGNGDIIRAIDYGIPWQKEFKDYQAANLVASTKHVAITRIFIIPDLILQDAQKKKDLLESMKQQRNSGIKVMFTLESQLKNSTYYQQHNRGMVEFQYSGRGEILMLETVRYWEAIQRGEPPTLRVVWKPSELKDEDDYLNWLLNSPQSSGVKDFDPKAPAPF